MRQQKIFLMVLDRDQKCDRVKSKALKIPFLRFVMSGIQEISTFQNFTETTPLLLQE